MSYPNQRNVPLLPPHLLRTSQNVSNLDVGVHPQNNDRRRNSENRRDRREKAKREGFRSSFHRQLTICHRHPSIVLTLNDPDEDLVEKQTVSSKLTRQRRPCRNFRKTHMEVLRLRKRYTERERGREMVSVCPSCLVVRHPELKLFVALDTDKIEKTSNPAAIISDLFQQEGPHYI